jgi:DNA-directed RNA polymerase specialized sigma24 family protein
MHESLSDFPQSPRFPTTSWTLIVNARQEPRSDVSRDAFAGLCGRYWYPIYAFIRRKGVDAEEARDCTQEFFAVLLEKDYLSDVERSRGKFRSFLLAAVSHFLSNQFDTARALKRGGGRKILSLEMENAEGVYRKEPAHSLTPEALFEYRWATSVLDRALKHLREDFGANDFDVLKPFLLGKAERGESPVAAERLRLSEGAFKVAVHRLRKRYREVVKAEIAETVADPAEIEGEVRYLIEVLGKGTENSL